MKILLLSGSLRKSSYSTDIVNTLASLSGDNEIQNISLSQFFNPDLDKQTLALDSSANEVVFFINQQEIIGVA